MGASPSTVESEWCVSASQWCRSDDSDVLTQGFTAAHLGAIVATLWVLLLNAVVGFQMLEDGTPTSLGLLLLSAIALFIGTGYIALDTAFSWTGHFAPSLNDPNRNIGLYVLYLLVPLVFLALFFVLETVLVLRVLGERKPMRKSDRACTQPTVNLTRCSLSGSRGTLVCYRPDLSVRHQPSHLPRYQRQNQRCLIRNPLYITIGGHGLGFLVEHNRRRLAGWPTDTNIYIA